MGATLKDFKQQVLGELNNPQKPKVKYTLTSPEVVREAEARWEQHQEDLTARKAEKADKK